MSDANNEIEFFPGLTREEIFAQWTAALRSGAYKQGKEKLRDDALEDEDGHRLPPAFCCLGVLCDLAEKAKPESASLPRWDDDYFVFDSSTGYFEEGVDEELSSSSEINGKMLTRLGMHDSDQQQLIRLNDGGDSFTAIAEFIEKSVPTYLAQGTAAEEPEAPDTP